MNKVDLILETILFTKNKFRGVLAAFLEDCLSRDFHIQVQLNNLPSAVIFNNNNVLREEIGLRIKDAKPFIGFEHDTNDKLLQNDEWESFLNQPHDVKRNIIITGIKKIWMSYQEEIIEKNLNNDTIVDNLPF
jgi:hypothetical protein